MQGKLKLLNKCCSLSENTKYMYDVREVLGPCLGTMQIFVKILYFQSSKKKKKKNDVLMTQAYSEKNPTAPIRS